MKKQIKTDIIRVLEEKYIDGESIIDGYIPDVFNVVQFVEDITNMANEIEQENERLQEKYDYWHSKCNMRYKENKRLREAFEYVEKAIYTQHVTMNHMENTEFEKGQISGLIIAANIIRKTFSECEGMQKQ